jgi:hypothetical protein
MLASLSFAVQRVQDAPLRPDDNAETRLRFKKSFASTPCVIASAGEQLPSKETP